mmetsp:Transcript_34556/g.104237  ORF Transcript_34556/g.104237 Transcript_34556/m.104237 type:complete len:200 (+) Transcript_34556:268-867(+)
MEAETRPTRQRIVSALRRWEKGAAAAQARLDACGRLALELARVADAGRDDDLAAGLAETSLERKMMPEHLALTEALEKMERAAADLRGLAAAASEEVAGEPYHALEERGLRRQAAGVVDMLDKHLVGARRVWDDVLWCEDGDTHAIYGAYFLLRPHVREEDLTMLREVCELRGDLAPEEAAATVELPSPQATKWRAFGS